jgi:chemotaxis protein methyltransferase CheR
MGLAQPKIDPTATTAAGPTEFAFGAADFERVRTLIHQRAGISLNPGKQAMV